MFFYVILVVLNVIVMKLKKSKEDISNYIFIDMLIVVCFIN